ncbi:response regulator transcription factor [Bradyrhizobium sp. STM 3843]|uniref:LuxR C-terminal-related transcriptional regulator n=1 Tax=Bradyrhizobium sp. STM 3843 TaxID=551947 RepID=UPI0009FC886A|nr:response regulator transcription factor [Bradyrhizobium sp. STM 3843]
MKNEAHGPDRAISPDLQQPKPLLTQQFDERPRQDSRIAQSSGRRRSTLAATERGSVWSAPKGAILVGGNVLLREGLTRIVAGAGFRIIASAPWADDRVLSTIRQDQPILLIIDLCDDFDTGLRQISCFKQRHPVGRVVVLANQHRLPEMVSAFRAGANAYLVKVATCETFVKYLELVMLGVTLLPPEILTLISDRQVGGRSDGTIEIAADEHAHDDDGGENRRGGLDVDAQTRPLGDESDHTPRLSARQLAILRGLAEGDSNKTIARKIAMAEATVKVHVKAILRKIRVRNRTQAAIWAMSNHSVIPTKNGLTAPSEELPFERSPDLQVTHVLSEGYANGSGSLAKLALTEVSQITMPDQLCLVRKSD